MERECLYLPPRLLFLSFSVCHTKLSKAHNVDPQSIKLLKVSKWSCIFYIFNTFCGCCCFKCAKKSKTFIDHFVSIEFQQIQIINVFNRLHTCKEAGNTEKRKREKKRLILVIFDWNVTMICEILFGIQCINEIEYNWVLIGKKKKCWVIVMIDRFAVRTYMSILKEPYTVLLYKNVVLSLFFFVIHTTTVTTIY